MRALLLLLALPAGAFADSINYFAEVYTQDSVNGGQFLYLANDGFQTLSNQVLTLPSDPYRSENTTTTAIVGTGTLKAGTSGYVLSSAPTGTLFVTLAGAIIADTITARGPIGGKDLTTNLVISGSEDIAPQLGFDGNYTDTSGLIVAFYKAGYFDHPRPTTDIVATYYWGLLGGTPPPGLINATYEGQLSSLPASVPFDVPFSLIGSDFQMSIQLVAGLVGDGDGGIGWTQDFAHSLNASLSAPAGITLTSAGGLPGTIQATPEPGSLLLITFGLLAVVTGRRVRAR